MAETEKASVGGIFYHVMNRGNKRPEKGLKSKKSPITPVGDTTVRRVRRRWVRLQRGMVVGVGSDLRAILLPPNLLGPIRGWEAGSCLSDSSSRRGLSPLRKNGMS